MSKVLIVDANNAVCSLMQSYLEEMIDECYIVSSGARVLEAIGDLCLDLVIVSNNLEKSSVQDVITMIRNHEKSSKAPILTIAYGGANFRSQEYMDKGSSSKMLFPFSQQEFQEEVSGMLGRDDTLREPRDSTKVTKIKPLHVRERLSSRELLYQNWDNLPEPLTTLLTSIVNKVEPELREGSNDELTESLYLATERYSELLERFVKLAQNYKTDLTDEQKRRISLLQSHPLFKNLKTFDLMILAEHMEEWDFQPNIVVLEQYHQTEYVYFIDEGQVEVLVNNELVAQRGKGSSFGEISCLTDDATATATIKTITDCRLLCVSHEKFLETVNYLPQLWRSLFKDLTLRFNEINSRFTELLQHTPIGLIKILSDGKISNEFSKKCVEYLGSHHLTGKYLHELLLPDDLEKQKRWKEVLATIFSKTGMEFELISGFFPHSVSLNFNGVQREYELSYYPCYSFRGEICAMDVGMEDVTEKYHYSRKTTFLETERSILQSVYENLRSYRLLLQFTEETQESMGELLILLGTKKKGKIVEFAHELLRKVHTLRGACSIFMLDEMVPILSSWEELLCPLLSKKASYDLNAFIEAKELYDQQYQYMDSLTKNISQRLQNRLVGVVMEPQVFSELSEAIEKRKLSVARNILENASEMHVHDLTQHWQEERARLCIQLNKQVRLLVEGENFKIPEELFDQLEFLLIHLLRNSLDHGIETPHERLQVGKDEVGTIVFKTSKNGGVGVIEISDDGRGLDIQHLIEKARSEGKLSETFIQRLIDTDEVWKMLFLAGQSTATEITDISGLGIGLEAVDHRVRAMKGKVYVEHSINERCNFIIEIPLEEGYS